MRLLKKVLAGFIAASIFFSVGIIPNKVQTSFPLRLSIGTTVYAVGAEDAAYKFADPEMEKAVSQEIFAKDPFVSVGAHAPVTNKQVANLRQLFLSKKYKIKTYKDLKNFSKLNTITIEKLNVNKSDFWSSIRDLEGVKVLTVIDEYYTDLSQLFQTKAKDTITCINISSMDKKAFMQLKGMKSLRFIYSDNNRKIENFDGVELPYGCSDIYMSNSALKNIDGLRKYPLDRLIVSGKNLEIRDPSFKRDYYGASILGTPYLSIGSTKFAEGIKNKKIVFPNALEEKVFKTAIGKNTNTVLTYGDVINTYEISLDEAKLRSLNLTQEQKEQFISHYLQRTDFIPPGLNICNLSIDVEALFRKGIVNEKNVNYLVLLEEQLPTEYLYNVEKSTVGNADVEKCKIKIFHPDLKGSSFISNEYYSKIQDYALLRAMKRNKITGYMEKVKQTDMVETELFKARFAHSITWKDVSYYRTNIQARLQRGLYTKQRAEEEEKKLGTAATQRIVKYMQELGLQASSFVDENGAEKIRFVVKGKEYICDYDKFTDLGSFEITSETVQLMDRELSQYTTDLESLLKKTLYDIANEERDYYTKSDVAKPKKTFDMMDFFKVKSGM